MVMRSLTIRLRQLAYVFFHYAVHTGTLHVSKFEVISPNIRQTEHHCIYVKYRAYGFEVKSKKI